MHAFSIPRTDPGSEGIEIIWTWPEGLPLSIKGYDILRLDGREFRTASRCETIGADQIPFLRTQAEMLAPLGPLRLRGAPAFQNITTAAAALAQTAKIDFDSTPAFTSLSRLTPLSTEFTSGPPLAAIGKPAIDTFIQELNEPANRVTVTVNARAAFAVALVAGKAVATGLGIAPTVIDLAAAGIDTVMLYTLGVTEFTLCGYYSGKQDDDPWAHATVIVKGLTLPIKEADPALGSPAKEYAAAKSRLVGAELLDPGRFKQLSETLRAPAAATGLGPGGAVISLNRAATDQSFEEMPFDQQITALALHPKARRVLGFGHHDRSGLVPGNTYLYRVIGRFEAADQTDTFYDFHRLPASTVLPDSFWIRDVGFRFQSPVKVVLDPAPNNGLYHAARRRGIRIDTSGYDDSWLLPFYDEWSALITLPAPVTKLVLEVAPGHSFSYAAGLPWAFGSPAPVRLPAGGIIELDFPAPVLELRLAGIGTLYALRLPSGASGKVEVHADAPPVVYAAVPLPAPPLVLVAANLQQPSAPLSGPIDESTPVPPRQPVGLRLTWLPSPYGGVPIWPDDIDSGPPLDAIAYAIDHRSFIPPASFGAWEPINADDNLILGSRDMTAPKVRLDKGCNLDELFPAGRPRSEAGLTLSYSDVFGEKDPTTGVVRPAQKLGSYHQYRIRAVDAAGRISGAETLSNTVRLEKHQPPPLPAGPQPAPGLDAQGRLTAPPGPRARAIIKGAPGLTAADIATLGAHQNAIVLEWGWRQAERDLDPYTNEFRVYATQPADTVTASITAVNSAPPYWKLSLTTNQPLVADELAGQWLTSGGYPFLIVKNDAGVNPTLRVELSKLKPDVQPIAGTVVFGRPLRAAHQSPASWDQRVAVYPLTASDTYRHVFYDILTLSVAHPRDAIWVGVSAADAESYVPDERNTGAFANRPGNESAIVTCSTAEHYRGQPVFSVPPPLGDVPELVAEEPTGRQVLVSLDLSALLAGSLPAGSPVVLERCGADEILQRTAIVAGQVVLTHPGGSTEIIAFPNPADAAEVLTTLGGPTPERLANRYLLHLLAGAANPGAFFTRPSADILTVGTVTDRIAPKPGRFLYFLRAADQLGHISEGGALLPLIVRVPSIAAAAAPLRRSLTGSAGKLVLTVAVPADPDTTTLLLFAVVTPPGVSPAPQPEAELLRVPNRRDLYPHDGIRLRLDDGTLLAPALTKNLADADVSLEPDGSRAAVLQLAIAPGSWATIWSFALTRDGQPSRPCGPFGQGVLP